MIWLLATCGVLFGLASAGTFLRSLMAIPAFLEQHKRRSAYNRQSEWLGYRYVHYNEEPDWAARAARKAVLDEEARHPDRPRPFYWLFLSVLLGTASIAALCSAGGVAFVRWLTG